MQGTPTPADKQVTWANWQFGPYNRWSYQNVREVLPTAVLNSPNGQASPLPQNLQDLDDLTVQTDAYGALDLISALQLTYTDGFLVMHRGEMIYETYLNGLRPDQPHLLWSVSKRS